MRLRNAVAAGLGALTLLLTVSTPANAATGTFEYKLRDTQAGKKLTPKITNPKDGECYTVPGHNKDRGYYAQNGTNAVVVLYSGFNCDGEGILLAPGDTGAGSSTHQYFGSFSFEVVEG
ncbi:hypothetical protein [Streptomyces sp. NPDC087525]|uniref:hypothetical protein n=1 Tax=Streptomyces sp. NPDC087525 TaxID=3365793 RepID=UPI0038037FD9